MTTLNALTVTQLRQIIELAGATKVDRVQPDTMRQGLAEEGSNPRRRNSPGFSR
jgi:hypothetical protein